VTNLETTSAAAKGACFGAGVCPLSQVPAGATVCIRSFTASPEIRARLHLLGLAEKQEVKILSCGQNFICEVCDAKLDLNLELAEQILVEPLALPVRQLKNFAAEVSKSRAARPLRTFFRIFLGLAALAVVAILVWQGLTAKGNPDPTAPHTSPTAAVLDIGVLVFREGLESILVLAAIIASMRGERATQRRPIVLGAAGAGVGTLITWFVAVGIISNLQENISALNLQAATGLLAVVVLLVVMNWFFHKVYWGGWIAMHNRNKKNLLERADESEISNRKLMWGLVLLGFASLYREGFEIVLFLQTYYLQLGGKPVLQGALLGIFFTSIVAVLTFIAHKKLPYRKMLISTGVMLGFVLLVMVGEQAFEMQQAGWIHTTQINWLADKIPAWAGVWFSVYPTWQTLIAQLLAAVLVIGSYFAARLQTAKLREEEEMAFSKT